MGYHIIKKPGLFYVEKLSTSDYQTFQLRETDNQLAGGAAVSFLVWFAAKLYSFGSDVI